MSTTQSRERAATLAEEVRAIMADTQDDADRDIVSRGTDAWPVVIVAPRVKGAPSRRYGDALEAAGFETKPGTGNKALYVRPDPDQ